MTKLDTKSEPDGASPRATAWALGLAIAPLCWFGLSLVFFLGGYKDVSRSFSGGMMFFIFVGSIAGALFVGKGDLRRERWRKWRTLAMFAHIIWGVIAILLGIGMVLNAGYSG